MSEQVTAAEQAPPRAFISYSWTSDDHCDWVLELATELRQMGVDVILDKWDLHPGHDATAFMESMVTDPSISKVIIVADRAYCEKANDRHGGVGTETQVITSEIYGKRNQDKYVVVTRECDDDGLPCVPAYYRNRIRFDMVEDDCYADTLEELTNWAYDRPLRTKPPLGPTPSFIAQPDAARTGTEALQKLCVAAVRDGKTTVPGRVAEYLDATALALGRYQPELDGRHRGELAQTVLTAVKATQPLRNEILEITTLLVRYRRLDDAFHALLVFLDRLLTSAATPPEQHRWRTDELDSLSFLAHEVFVCVLAVLVDGDQTEHAARLMAFRYSDDEPTHTGRLTGSFTDFRQYLPAFEVLDHEQGLAKCGYHAQLLENRCANQLVSWQSFVQADFIAFLRSELAETGALGGWYPITAPWLVGRRKPLPVFAKARSRAECQRVLQLVGCPSLEHLDILLAAYASGSRRLPQGAWGPIDPTRLIGRDDLATQA